MTSNDAEKKKDYWVFWGNDYIKKSQVPDLDVNDLILTTETCHYCNKEFTYYSWNYDKCTPMFNWYDTPDIFPRCIECRYGKEGLNEL